MYEGDGVQAQAMPGALTQVFGKNGGFGSGDNVWAWILPWILNGGYINNRRGYESDADSATNQNVESLRQQVQQNTSASQFEALTAQIGAFQAASDNTNHQNTLATNQQFQQLCQQIAACCCDNRVATERINTSIALASRDNQAQMLQCCCDLKESIAGVNMNLALHGKDVEKSICDQTSALQAQAQANTTQILNAIDNNERSRLEQDLAAARTELIIANQTKQEATSFANVNSQLQAILNKLTTCS